MTFEYSLSLTLSPTQLHGVWGFSVATLSAFIVNSRICGHVDQIPIPPGIVWDVTYVLIEESIYAIRQLCVRFPSVGLIEPDGPGHCLCPDCAAAS